MHVREFDCDVVVDVVGMLLLQMETDNLASRKGASVRSRDTGVFESFQKQLESL